MVDNPQKKMDIHATTSDRSGFAGVFESILRRFRALSFTLLLSPIFVFYALAIGISLTPAVLVFQFIYDLAAPYPILIKSFILGLTIAFGYLCFGITLIFVVPLINFILPLRIKPFRGTWFSLSSIPWYYHNALVQLVRYTFLDIITPTPLNVLYFRLMGMKIGKGVQINTSNISDPCLITLDDYVVIGGSATIFAHYGQKGFLIVEPVHIKKDVNIGLKSSIMGDVIIGERASVRAHAVLLPKTRVKDDEIVENK